MITVAPSALSLIHILKEADLTAGLEAKGAKAASIPEAESEPPAEENLQTHWSLKLALFGIEKLLILLLALFDTFCLVFILTVCGLRIRANYHRKKLFMGADDRLAVRAMAGYARVLYAHGSDPVSYTHLNPASALMAYGTITWQSLLAFYISGAPVDLVHALSTVIFLWFLSRPLLEKLERIKKKYGLIESQKEEII